MNGVSDLANGLGEIAAIEYQGVSRMAPKPKNRIRPRRYEAAARYVYVLAREDGMTKVGISKSVNRRASAIRSATPDRLVVAHRHKPNGRTAFEIEAAAHRLLAPWRTRGEWFKCTPGLARLAIETAETGSQRGVDFIAGWAKQQALLLASEAARSAAKIADDPAAALLKVQALKAEFLALAAQLIADYPAEIRAADGEHSWFFVFAKPV